MSGLRILLLSPDAAINGRPVRESYRRANKEFLQLWYEARRTEERESVINSDFYEDYLHESIDRAELSFPDLLTLQRIHLPHVCTTQVVDPVREAIAAMYRGFKEEIRMLGSLLHISDKPKEGWLSDDDEENESWKDGTFQTEGDDSWIDIDHSLASWEFDRIFQRTLSERIRKELRRKIKSLLS